MCSEVLLNGTEENLQGSWVDLRSIPYSDGALRKCGLRFWTDTPLSYLTSADSAGIFSLNFLLH